MTTKTCPVCGFEQGMERSECSRCGWDFSPLLGSAEQAETLLRERLRRARTGWRQRCVIPEVAVERVAPEHTHDQASQLSGTRSRVLISGRYRDLGNGTVLDTKTRLQWMRCALWQTWDGETCVGKADDWTWHDLPALIESFNQQGGYGDHEDWRLPTVDELKTLIVLGTTRPTIDRATFPNTPGNFFWTSSARMYMYTREGWGVDFNDGRDTREAWGVDFNDGRVESKAVYEISGPISKLDSSPRSYLSRPTGVGKVRLVRGGRFGVRVLRLWGRFQRWRQRP